MFYCVLTFWNLLVFKGLCPRVHTGTVRFCAHPHPFTPTRCRHRVCYQCISEISKQKPTWVLFMPRWRMQVGPNGATWTEVRKWWLEKWWEC